MKSIRFSIARASILLCTLTFLLSFNLISCKTEIENLSNDSSLFGTWTDTYASHYTISTTEFKNYGDTYSSYEGDNLVVKYLSSNTEGIIFIKYTISMNEDFSYSSTAPDVGKWYAICFKDLTTNSVKISGAYNPSRKTSTETLEEAITEFTIDNGYFAYFSDCNKKSIK